MEAQGRVFRGDPGSTGTSLKNRVKTKENHVPQSRVLVPESANLLLSKGPETRGTRDKKDQRQERLEGPETKGTRDKMDQRQEGPETRWTRDKKDQRLEGPETRRTIDKMDHRLERPETLEGPETRGTID
ncbi:hypothetical protein EYF80_028726 [Liparis tanakae]|uniref:Uncharacterized protein n=1 Tax=Liparis tanakae TaxID=230148 RepID=A0A4Z2H7T2_9TELE|nr:hypothetical protein EYF80_028726 [Liparis tanakae]